MLYKFGVSYLSQFFCFPEKEKCTCSVSPGCFLGVHALASIQLALGLSKQPKNLFELSWV